MLVWYLLIVSDVTTDIEVYLYSSEEAANKAFRDQVKTQIDNTLSKGLSVAACTKDCLIQRCETGTRRTAFFSRTLTTTGAEMFILLSSQEV